MRAGPLIVVTVQHLMHPRNDCMETHLQDFAMLIVLRWMHEPPPI